MEFLFFQTQIKTIKFTEITELNTFNFLFIFGYKIFMIESLNFNYLFSLCSSATKRSQVFRFGNLNKKVDTKRTSWYEAEEK